jgi:hypothetical protein
MEAYGPFLDLYLMRNLMLHALHMRRPQEAIEGFSTSSLIMGTIMVSKVPRTASNSAALDRPLPSG